MGKIKINLASGNSIEKPLITCFKGTNGDYIILDNETNGQMGYPIICISKLVGTHIEKIIDQGEWASVKENLKTIISGTALPYLNVPELLEGNDDFFTQLTLPVSSFDLLKNVYAPAQAAPTPEVAPANEETAVVQPETPISLVEGATMTNAEPTNIVDINSIVPNQVETPVVNESQSIITPVTPVSPVVPTSENEVTIPTAQIEPVQSPVAPVDTEVTPSIETPVISQEQPAVSEDNDMAALKESFLKSCENMFDALVKKFNK